MVLFEGDQIREGGPNPLADMFRSRTKSASGFGPAGPNPLGDLALPDQIRGGPNLLVHRSFEFGIVKWFISVFRVIAK